MMQEDLSRRDALFVSTYVQTGDAVEACKAAGLGPREASKTLARLAPSIAAAKAADASAEPAPAPSLTALERAKRAYDLAERESNGAVMVSSAQLIARLQGDLVGNEAVEPVKSSEPVPDRDMARALLSLVREVGQTHPEFARAFHLAVQVMEGGTLVAVSRPGETLVSVKNPDLAAAMGGVVCMPLETSKGDSNGTD